MTILQAGVYWEEVLNYYSGFATVFLAMINSVVYAWVYGKYLILPILWSNAARVLLWPLGIGTYRWSVILLMLVFGIFTCDIGLSIGFYFGIENRLVVLPIFAFDICSVDIPISKITLYFLILWIIGIAICQYWLVFQKYENQKSLSPLFCKLDQHSVKYSFERCKYKKLTLMFSKY